MDGHEPGPRGRVHAGRGWGGRCVGRDGVTRSPGITIPAWLRSTSAQVPISFVRLESRCGQGVQQTSPLAATQTTRRGSPQRRREVDAKTPRPRVRRAPFGKRSPAICAPASYRVAALAAPSWGLRLASPMPAVTAVMVRTAVSIAEPLADSLGGDTSRAEPRTAAWLACLMRR